MHRRSVVLTVFVLFALLAGPSVAGATPGAPVGPDGALSARAAVLGTGFTYQGQLKNASGPVTNSCSMAFRLFDAAGSGSPPSGGSPIGNPITTTVGVANGLFTVALNSGGEFGPSAFTGSARWLQIAVQCPPDTGFTTLAPRQALTAAPYALYASGNWGLSGNGGTTAGNFIGTTDSAALTLEVNNTAALRIVPNATSANIIGGDSSNSVGVSVVGATIGGGGQGIFGLGNTASGDFSTIGGGEGNSVGYLATVGGGDYNKAIGSDATVGGGDQNTAGYVATVGGGTKNTAGGPGATVSGGGTDGSNYVSNRALGAASTVGGGLGNVVTTSASYGTVGGGNGNTVSGNAATVPGGESNTAQGKWSLAAGRRAKAQNNGAFVWADSTNADFASTGNDQFLVRASGGVGINTNTPGATLDVSGTVRVGSNGVIGTAFAAIQSGATTVYTSNSASLVYTVTFPSAFSVTPIVIATARADPSWDVPDTFAVSVRRLSTSYVVFNIERVDSATGWSQYLIVDWIAWQ